MADSSAPAPVPKGTKPQAARDWFDHEAAPGATILKLGHRLFQRGRASWLVWVTAALLVSGAWTLFKVKSGRAFEATVVVRVSEGKMSKAGTMPSRGKLRAYVDDLAFTNTRLIELMSKHPKRFPKAATDPVFAVQSFRENLTIEITDNDFVEERGPDDPPRSARMLISFKGPDPEFAWQIAQELAARVGGSAMADQRAGLEVELQAATDAASKAAAAVSEMEEQNVVGPNPHLEAARQRLLAAQQRVQEASVGLRALGQQQVLKFEIIERGRIPPRPDLVLYGVRTFAITGLLALLAAWLLAGAFDPRVVDEADVTGLLLPVLGRLPGVPERAPDRSGSTEDTPERGAATSGIPDSRV
jgi:hypothetical protein